MLACAGHDIDAEMRVDAWQAAQHVVQHYKTTTGLPPSRVSYPDACPQGGSCLRVLFLRRSTSTAMRQLLNLAELMERCNGWRHTDAATGKTYTASCAAYETSDLLHDIAGAPARSRLLVKMQSATSMWLTSDGIRVLSASST